MLLWWVLVSLVCPSLGDEFIISHECPLTASNGCSTLNDHISQNSTFPSNSVVKFSDGSHVVTDHTTQAVFMFQNVQNLTLIGEGDCVIECTDEMMFAFANIVNLSILNMRFLNCGAAMSTDLLQETVALLPGSSDLLRAFNPNQYVTMFLFHITDLTVSSLDVQNSTGFGVIAVNVFGTSVLSDLIISNNKLPNSQCDTISTHAPDCSGGGLRISYTDTPNCDFTGQIFSLEISSSEFSYNKNYDNVGFGAGVSFQLTQSMYGVHIEIDNTTSDNNLGVNGANFAIIHYITAYNSSVSINNSFASNSNSMVDELDSRKIFSGGGLYYSYGSAVPVSAQLCQRNSEQMDNEPLYIANTNFVGNLAGLGSGAYITISPLEGKGYISEFKFKHCLFLNNTGSPGSALHVYQRESITAQLIPHFHFTDCRFSYNEFPHQFHELNQEIEYDVLNTLYFNSAQFVFFDNCQFTDNVGTGLYAYNTRMWFQNRSLFTRNSGLDGGGLALHGNSLMLLAPNTKIFFSENEARRGAAIFVANQNYRANILCFWQLAIDSVANVSVIEDLKETFNIEVSFSANHASEAGSVLYGGSVDSCSLNFVIDFASVSTHSSERAFEELFTFQNSNSSSSADITSAPSRVFICCEMEPTDVRDMCTPTSTVRPIYPGATIEIYLYTVGQRDNPSPGIIYANLKNINENENSENETNYSLHTTQVSGIGRGQRTQQSTGACMPHHYTIFPSQAVFLLEFSSENSILGIPSTNVTIHAQNCPLGFDLIHLGEENRGCDCAPFFEDRVNCYIEDQTFERSSPEWFGEVNNTILYCPFCPFDYCVKGHENISFATQDRQCAFNRTGVLCGACPDGLSVIFGGSECWDCDNVNLLLIVLFAILGLLLVGTLFLFDSLTVSAGTINGLIFYATILENNKAIFVPPEQHSVGTAIIAWLALDWGIPICFYDGMTTMVKTWLEFVFPIYLMLILGCVIIASQYSTTVSKLLTQKSVGVFATILLLIFSRLQRIMISSFSYIALAGSDAQVHYVWKFDGNIDFLSLSSVLNIDAAQYALFIIGCLLLLFVVFPFNFGLLFAKQLQMLSSYHYFKWINKLKPLLDAYMGPYKDNYRFWTGLLLVTRQIIIAVSIIGNQPADVLLCIAIVVQVLSAFTWFSGGVYKKLVLNVLECSFFLNLTILTTATLYVVSLGNIPEASYYQIIIVHTSISVALLELLLIVIYAVCRRITDSTFHNRHLIKCQKAIKTLYHPYQWFDWDRIKTSFKSKKKEAPDNADKRVSFDGPTTSVVDLDFLQQHENEERLKTFVHLRESILEAEPDRRCPKIKNK